MSKTRILTDQPIISLLGKELYSSLPDDEASIKSREKTAAMLEASLSDMEKDPSNPVHYGRAGVLCMVAKRFASKPHNF